MLTKLYSNIANYFGTRIHQMKISILKWKLGNKMIFQETSMVVTEDVLNGDFGADVIKLFKKEDNSYVITKGALRIIASASSMETKSRLWEKNKISKLVTKHIKENVALVNKLADSRNGLVNLLHCEDYAT